MSSNKELTQIGLRRTGRRSGCSCCSFTMVGLIAFPLMAVVALLRRKNS